MFQCNRIVTIALNIMVSIGTLTAGNKPPDSLFMPISIDKAIGLALKQNRIVFIDFCTTWCGACDRLDEDTWSNKNVIKQLKKSTIPLKIDADKEPLIRDKYHVRAYPTLLFLNSDGSVRARFVGFKIPTQFIQTLQGVVVTKGSRVRNQKMIDGDH